MNKEDRSDVVITATPNLTSSQAKALDFHSIHNVVNIMLSEFLQFSQIHNGYKDGLGSVVDVMRELKSGISTISNSKYTLHEVQELLPFLNQDIDWLIEYHVDNGGSSKKDARVLKTLVNVLAERVKEIELRLNGQNDWYKCSPELLEGNLRKILNAIEVFSLGAFRFNFDSRERGPTEYWINLEFKPYRGRSFFLPVGFEEILRDIVANARKFTPIGGEIRVWVTQDSDNLFATIEDNGIGIPSDEIQNVYQFGIRGTNTQNIRAFGGGFGLTKAVAFTTGWGGQLAISSGEGLGTKISLQFPTKKIDQTLSEPQNQ